MNIQKQRRRYPESGALDTEAYRIIQITKGKPMKSIDVFCHLMPPEYAKICMAEAPNKSHMFVRALNVASMSNMDARNEVLKAFPGYKQIPNIVSPPVETFAGPDKSPRLAAIGNDEIKKIVEANPEFYEGFIAGIPFNNVKASVEEIKRAKDMGAKVLLTKTDKSITQVAAECGYDDFTYFSRQFKKATSLTPSAYRKTHADEDEEQKR